MYAKSPKGSPIVGTLETVPGVALVSDGSFRRDASEAIDFDYAGETDIWWDAQRTVVRDGERVFLDDAGGEWLESQIVLADADPDEVGEPAAINIDITGRERDTILAALRFWQAERVPEAWPDHFEVAVGDLDSPLADDEIDALCERVNTGE